MNASYAPALIGQATTPLVLRPGEPEEVTTTRVVSRLRVGAAAEQRTVERFDIFWLVRGDRIGYLGATALTAAASLVVPDLTVWLANALVAELARTGVAPPEDPAP